MKKSLENRTINSKISVSDGSIEMQNVTILDSAEFSNNDERQVIEYKPAVFIS